MNWTEILKMLIPVAGSVFVVYLAYLFAVKKLRKESRENIERKKYEAILQAHQSIYKLLAYTTDTENAKTIIVWTAEKGDKAHKTYYLRKNNAREFMTQLAREFYEYGNGLFLSPQINNLLFEYRSIVYGFLLSTKRNEEEHVEIEKTETAKRMVTINQELRKEIRKSIGLAERDLVSLKK